MIRDLPPRVDGKRVRVDVGEPEMIGTEAVPDRSARGSVEQDVLRLEPARI